MIVDVKNKKIFLNAKDVDLSPRVIDKRKIDKGNGQRFSQENRFEDILTVEISCFVDQKAILTQDISEIKVFTSSVTLNSLKKRASVLSNRSKNTPGPAGANNNSLGPAGQSIESSKRKKSRKKSKIQKSIERKLKNNAESKRGSRTSNIINVISDIDKISQNLNSLRFSSLKFLTKINVNQILAASKIKNIQNLTQTDSEIFGEREVFEIRPAVSLKSRIIKKSSKEVSVPVTKSANEESASDRNFRSAYFSKVKLGKDPLSSFQHSDDFTSLQERLMGISSLKKNKDDRLRNIFKIISQKESDSASSAGNFRIVKSKQSKRKEIYKTTFEIPRKKLKEMSSRSSINLIFYAYNKKGIKVDSFSQIMNIKQLFSTEVNPTIDFSVSTSRTNRGNIITSVSNEELDVGSFNIYQKFFSKSQNFKRKSFSLLADDFDVSPKNTVRLVDGKIQNRTSPQLSKTKSVFHRVTSNFKDREIFNTKSSSTDAVKAFSNQLTCAVYVEVETETNENRGATRATVTITNLSEDVYAVLPVKRTAKGNRGNDFKTVKYLNAGLLEDNEKTFVDKNEDDAVFTFFDDDLEDDVIYEYSAILYSRSGVPQLSGSRFLEKSVEREGLINADIETNIIGFSTDDNGAPTIHTEFDVTLNRQEDDVDKIINGLFGDNRSLFEDDLKEIKDASNLSYGVRVHKIDTATGEFLYVGSFRAFKQENADAQSSTDIPKTYRVKFQDFSSASNSQIYKIDPYLIPPAQVLDKVASSLANIIKQNNRSRSSLNKLLVSKQKILNQRVVSQIGTKFASIQGRKGVISSPESFVEKNRNDLFLEGATGDIEYEIVSPKSLSTSFDNFKIDDSDISLLKTLDVDPNSTNFIPKNLVRVEFSVGNTDNFVDFYVILRKENGSSEIIIDGAVHSTDLTEDKTFMNYTYLSKTKTSVGLISYFVVPVSKLGTKGPVRSIGSIVMRGR